jgi:poly(glycerol-phosphate) alpha-glucosyltransferase
MTIGILTPSLGYTGGGIATAVRGLARALAGARTAIPRVFGIERGDSDSAWKGALLCPSSGPAAFGYSPSLLQALRVAKLELLHVHGLWMYPSVAAPCWSGRERKPYIVSPHGMLDSWALRNAAWKKRIAALLYERRSLEGAACLHALTPAEAGAIRAFGLRNPICVIPNGVDLPTGPRPDPPDWARQWPPDTRVLLYLGRLHPKKGLSALLCAWASARIWKNSWRLVLAGWDQNGHAAELEQQCRALKITDSVSFIGPQFGAQKSASYAAAHAFILPSLSEGLPAAVLEAWSHRLPVLMSGQCNLPEGFEAGAALPIEPAPESIASGLRALASMPDSALSEIGKRGRRLVERKFTWSAVAQQLLAVYNTYA